MLGVFILLSAFAVPGFMFTLLVVGLLSSGRIKRAKAARAAANAELLAKAIVKEQQRAVKLGNDS